MFKGSLESDRLLKPLVSSYHLTRDVPSIISMLRLMATSQRNDWPGQFLLEVLNSKKNKTDPEQFWHIIDTFQKEGLHISSFACESICHNLPRTPGMESYNEKVKGTLEALVDSELGVINSELFSQPIPHPTQNLLSSPPRISFKRLSNLHNLLVHPKLPDPQQSFHFNQHNKRCMKQRCNTCKIHPPSETFNSRNTKKQYPFQGHHDCNTANLIYQLYCNFCEAKYNGLTTGPLRIRMNNHRFDTNHKDLDKPVPSHANIHSKNFDSCYTTRILGAFPTATTLNSVPITNCCQEFEAAGHEFSAGMIACMFDAHVRFGNLEEAEAYFKELTTSAPSFTLDHFKVVDFATLLVTKGKLKDAVSLLNKYPANIRGKGSMVSISRNCLRLLTAMSESGEGAGSTRDMLSLLVQQGYCTLNNIMLGPLIRAHLNSDDLPGAVSEFKRSAMGHGCTPLQHELLCRLVVEAEKGPTGQALLQETIKAGQQVHKIPSTHIALIVALAETGQEKQLRRFLMDPSVKINSSLLLARCQRLVDEDKLEPLHAIVSSTYNNANINNTPIFTYMLQIFSDNVLALTQAITSDYHLADTQLYKEGNLIFFDFLGLFVIRWSELFGLVINTSAVALSVFSVVKNMKHGMITNDVSRRDYMRQLVRSVGVALASWLLALLFAVLLALALTVLGCTMSWFSRPLWIVFLYIIPSLLVPMVLLSLVSRWQRPVIGSPWTLFQLYYDSYQLIWTFLLVLSIVFKIRSGLVPLMWVLFPALGNLMRDTFFRHCKDSRWLVFHISVLILPLTQCMYLILAALTLFVPVMGRSGAGNNAEVIVAILSSAQFVLLFSYLMPLILLVRSPQKVLGFLGSLFLLAVLLLVLTPLGFPYSGEMPSPRPQRFLITHTERTYHDIAGKVRSKETGYWVADLDLNSPDSVKSLVPEFARVRLVDDCEDELYCGLPYLMPVLSFLWKTHWIPAHPPDVPIPTTLTLMSTETRPPSVRRLTFNVTGPDHIGVMLSPISGVTLDRWSLVEGEPLKSSKWNTRDTYFVYYSYASDPEPLVFWIDLNVPDIDMKQILDIAVTSHFLHGPHKTSPEFVRFMGQFPSWASPSGWVATYSSFKF
uniref:Uncharacterized protein n=1 Tax=Timema tahoe TaxID=61484 RepID=A0A7R9IKW4_9NEOP|nr:unnamed protein product [Timema tahoe]